MDLILAVTLNFALDVTYHVERFERGETTRVDRVTRQAGGKGVNVARVLHGLGRPAAVTGLAGGSYADAARRELAAAGIRDELVAIGGQSRQTIIVAERDGRATGFSEPGPEVTAGEWERFERRFRGLCESATAVVLAGSLPRGVPDDAYAQLIRIAGASGIPVLLDAEGEALARGVGAAPEIVKVNEAELRSVGGAGDVVECAEDLRRRSRAGAVVVTRGADGLVAVTGGPALHAVAPEPVTGNPTGAGDAASAALIAGLLDGLAWPERLAHAVALSAAAVAAPVAGTFDDALYRRLCGEIAAGSARSV